MKALIVDENSPNPVMKIGEHPDPEPGSHELLVKIEATALNRADLMQKAGKYPPPDGASPILGLEMSGVVEATGENVQKYAKGDRVCGLLAGGGYAEKCVIHEEMAIPVPEDYSFEEAAAIPEIFLTAYQAVIWLGELKTDETILIHAGASGVGTAAIQIAKQLRQARIVATAGRSGKLDLCRSLGADLGVNYKEENFAEIIEQTFGKYKVDVIIDFIGSPYWEKNMSVLAMDSRLIYLSMLGGATVEKMNLVPILRKRLSIKGSTLRNRTLEYKIKLTKEFSNDCLNLFETGKLRPVIDSVFEWENAEKAHHRMGDNKNAGKIILTGM